MSRPMERFAAYAADFEKTLADDDWSRLEPYFSEDAVYRVESEAFGCELAGPAAIFAGIKKSLDGFDRHFAGRQIEMLEGPDVEGDTLRVAWRITYEDPKRPPFVLEGRSLARVRDDRIDLLVDSYDEERTNASLAAYQERTGLKLDPSYT